VPDNGRLVVPNWTLQLPLEEETLAERLKTRGYATASIGKWHLGNEEFYPTNHGFDVNIGGTHGGSPPSYFSPYKITTLPDGPKNEFLSDRLTNEAVKFIENHKTKPFYIYLPHYGVHTPIMGKPEVIAKYQAKRADRGHSNPVYAALVESVDDSVGTLRAKLKELNLAENTIFVFTSDNGGLSGTVSPNGWQRGPTDNSPARLGKGSAYEGGVHIPLIVSWPGKVKPGSTCNVPVITYDHVPTLLEATQTPLKEKQIVDGESLMPLLTETGTLKREAIYWHYPHYHPGSATPYSAIREGDWKLIQFYEDNHIELYNLKLDAGENDNRAQHDSVRALQLRDKLNAWLKNTGAQIPERNPKHDPDKPLNEPKKAGGKKKAV
jgi:arylsulfatase A-like enzyme